MPASALLSRLEPLHARSFGWALACCAGDRDRALEVLQTSYARVLDGSASWAGVGDFRAFLFGVVRRVASEHARRERREVEVRMAGARERVVGPATPTSLERLERDEAHAAMRDAIAALPERQREVLHLIFYQELSLREAAEVMGVGIGSARQHYARGKAAVRDHFQPLMREAT